jgi:hypothetical protein
MNNITCKVVEVNEGIGSSAFVYAFSSIALLVSLMCLVLNICLSFSTYKLYIRQGRLGWLRRQIMKSVMNPGSMTPADKEKLMSEMQALNPTAEELALEQDLRIQPIPPMGEEQKEKEEEVVVVVEQMT